MTDIRRIHMRKIRDVLRLHLKGRLSQRQIAAALGISKGVVAKYISLATQLGLGWANIAQLSETELERRLIPPTPPPDYFVRPDFGQLHHEMRRKGMTIMLLWQEFVENHPGERVHQYSQFSVNYRHYVKSLKRSLRMVHRAGEKLFIDFAGPTIKLNNGTRAHIYDLGCILFSQYYDTVRWIGNEMAKRDEFSGMDIGLYAGSNRSGFWRDGKFQRCDRNALKDRVRSGDLKLLLGTDAASEGLNLQRLGTLINIDLPWNPTRLEQRKGRIQRIGQARSEIWIANLRYRDSVEDKVHQVLADRLEAIHGLFGQIPDTLEDVWVQVALNDADAANQLIDRTTATRNPFDVKYSKVEDADWETCSTVLDPRAVKEQLSMGW